MVARCLQVALVIFTIDAVLGMVVMGFQDYLHDLFNKLDVIIIFVGYLDYAVPINISAISALRVLRVMKVL